MTYGSVLASFNVEEFGTERVQRLTRAEIDERYEEFRRDDGDRRRGHRCQADSPGALGWIPGVGVPSADERLLGGLLARGGAEDPDLRAALHRLVGGEGAARDRARRRRRRRLAARRAAHPRRPAAAAPPRAARRPRAAAPARGSRGIAPAAARRGHRSVRASRAAAAPVWPPLVRGAARVCTNAPPRRRTLLSLCASAAAADEADRPATPRGRPWPCGCSP